MKKLFEALNKNSKDIGILSVVFIISSFFLYGYYAFFTPDGLETVFRNWDGPGYLVVAKSLYDVDIIQKVNPFPFLYPSYFAYQFPLYPLFIRLFSAIGYRESMVFTSTLFGLGFTLALYFLVKAVNPRAHALMVALLSIFYMPRWFILSHVGSAEPTLLFFLTLFLFMLVKKRFLLSAVFLSLAQMTKSQGMLFFLGMIGLAFYRIFIQRKQSLRTVLTEFLPFFLVPLSLACVFAVYDRAFGDFFIYFGINNLNNVTQWPPLKILTATDIAHISVGFFTGWKESYVFIYVLYLLPIILLFQQKLPALGIIGLSYYIPLLFVFHGDVSRYAVPLLPIVFLGYSDALSKKAVYLTLLLCIPMVILFAIGYINYNLAPLPYQ